MSNRLAPFDQDTIVLAPLDWLAQLKPNTTVITVKVDLAELPQTLVLLLVAKELEPPPPLLRWPVGKGYFIWNLFRCANGSPTELANKCKAAHIDWVTIKVCEAGNPFNGNIWPWVDLLRVAGVRVWGWGYVYGGNPTAEADIAASRVKEFNLDGFMIDAESEYKTPAKAAAARTYTERLRSALPNVGLGLCSYRYPSLHRELPWAEFLAGCDFHAPQVYWIGALSDTSPGSQLARSVAELKALKNIPVVPVGVACDNPYAGGTWRPTVGQINNFDATARTLGLQGLSYWSFQHTEAIPEFWTAIAGHDWRG